MALQVRLSSLVGILWVLLVIFLWLYHSNRMRRALLKKFGTLVRIKRYARGLTQLKLAEYTGCSLQAIGNIERGEANPSLVMVYRLAKALEISPKDLLP